MHLKAKIRKFSWTSRLCCWEIVGSMNARISFWFYFSSSSACSLITLFARTHFTRFHYLKSTGCEITVANYCLYYYFLSFIFIRFNVKCIAMRVDCRNWVSLWVSVWFRFICSEVWMNDILYTIYKIRFSEAATHTHIIHYKHMHGQCAAFCTCISVYYIIQIDISYRTRIVKLIFIINIQNKYW